MGRTKKEEIVSTGIVDRAGLEEEIKFLVRSFYDLQKLRIQTGNRIVSSVKIQLGIKPSTKEDQDKDVDNFLSKLKKEYKLISDAVIENDITIKSFITSHLADISDSEDDKKRKSADVKLKLIRNQESFRLMDIYSNMTKQEENMQKVVEKRIAGHPLMEYLNSEECKGCGPLMSACVIAYFDIDKAKYESSFVRYAGLDPVYVTRKRKKDDTEESTYQIGRNRSVRVKSKYIDKDGIEKEKEGPGYNVELHDILLGRLGPCFIKCRGSFYEQIYRDQRHRLDLRDDTKNFSDGHKHAMANRYMITCFVKNVFAEWKHAIGEDVPEQYQVSKLRREPHIGASATKYATHVEE